MIVPQIFPIKSSFSTTGNVSKKIQISYDSAEGAPVVVVGRGIVTAHAQ